MCYIWLTPTTSIPPIKISVVLYGTPAEMELDTGTAFSVMAENKFREILPMKQLSSTNNRLRSYSGDKIEVLGSVDVSIKYNDHSACVPLLILKGDGPTLLGRNWLHTLKLDWKAIYAVQQSNPLQVLLQKYQAIFQQSLGTLKGFKAHIHVDPAAKPKYCKARSIPYAFKAKEELDRLVKEGILEPIRVGIPVLKPDNKSVRICGDFKQTVNPVAKLD